MSFQHFIRPAVTMLLPLLTAVAGSLPVSAQQPSRLVATFPEAHVVVQGVTPRGRVALIGVAREPLGYQSRLRLFFEIVEDEDGDGTVRYSLDGAVAWKSIWGLVDLRTGDYTVARPERSPGRAINFKGQGIGRGSNGRLSTLQHAGQWLQVALVKSNGAVFQALVVDGGPLDEDGRNDNVVNVSIEALGLVRGNGDKPEEYRPGDVLFVVDPHELTMVAVQVK